MALCYSPRMPGCVGTCQTKAEPCWVLRAWLLFVTGSVCFTAGDKTSIRAGLPNGDNQRRDSPIPLFPLPPGWQASGKKSWISHVSACILGLSGMCPTVSCSGETGRMAEAFLLHSLGTQCWLHTSFNPLLDWNTVHFLSFYFKQLPRDYSGCWLAVIRSF